jgi:hypothetical protein
MVLKLQKLAGYAARIEDKDSTWKFDGQLEKANWYNEVIEENTKMYLAESISRRCEVECSG